MLVRIQLPELRDLTTMSRRVDPDFGLLIRKTRFDSVARHDAVVDRSKAGLLNLLVLVRVQPSALIRNRYSFTGV
jgi:hypothetical protein